MELPSRDEPAVDQDLPKRDVAWGLLLRAQRVLELRFRDQLAFDEQLAEARIQWAHEFTW